VTGRQRGRLSWLLRSAADVCCAVPELNSWRHRRQDIPVAGYQQPCLGPSAFDAGPRPQNPNRSGTYQQVHYYLPA
jgi:hypothetical protein